MSTPGSSPRPDDARSIRIGDAERRIALDDLTTHFTEGRIDQEEFDERSKLVFAARTRSDLEPLFHDLPGGVHDPVVAAAAEETSRSERVPARSPKGSTPQTGSVDAGSREAGGAPGTGMSRQTKRILLAVVPTIALVLFFVLGWTIGFQYSWLVFLISPLVWRIAHSSDADDARLRERRLERRENRRDRRDRRRSGRYEGDDRRELD